MTFFSKGKSWSHFFFFCFQALLSREMVWLMKWLYGYGLDSEKQVELLLSCQMKRMSSCWVLKEVRHGFMEGCWKQVFVDGIVTTCSLDAMESPYQVVLVDFVLFPILCCPWERVWCWNDDAILYTFTLCYLWLKGCKVVMLLLEVVERFIWQVMFWCCW